MRKITKNQVALLRSIYYECSAELSTGTWIELEDSETRSAIALEKRGLLTLDRETNEVALRDDGIRFCHGTFGK